MAEPDGVLPGTLDLLILKAVSLGTLHGYGVLLRIEQISGGALQIQQGALYPALYRLEHQGLIDSEWGTSDNNRRAKFYRLTRPGPRTARRRDGELESAGRRDRPIARRDAARSVTMAGRRVLPLQAVGRGRRGARLLDDDRSRADAGSVRGPARRVGAAARDRRRVRRAADLRLAQLDHVLAQVVLLLRAPEEELSRSVRVPRAAR